MKIIQASLLSIALIASLPAQADYVKKSTPIPGALSEWSEWAIKDDKNLNCPLDSQSERQCAWSKELLVVTSGNNINFRQEWTSFGDASLSLPWANSAYLESVTINGEKASLSYKEDRRPMVAVEKGNYLVEGVLNVPPQVKDIYIGDKTGLVSLYINDNKVVQPAIVHNQLSLQIAGKATPQKTQKQEKDSVNTQVWRHISQSIPTRMQTVIDLTITGKSRNINLGKVLPDDMQILNVSSNSRMPLSLSSEGELRVQVRSGHSQVTINTQRKGASEEYAFPENPYFPNSEIWSFERNVNLEQVSVEGGAIYDASRIKHYPRHWLSSPTYLLGQNDTLSLIALPDAENQQENTALNSDREYWMDFNGKGYFYRDTITGRRGELKRINATNGHELNHAKFGYSEDQVITLDPDSDEKGVELRSTDVNFIAEGRVERNKLSSRAWLAPVESLDVQIHVPPGMRIFHATGADSYTGSWIGQWQLLDFFLVIIVTVSFFKLFGLTAGIIALLGMVSTIHEPGSPQLIWLTAVILAGLSKVIPSGKLFNSVNRIRLGALLTVLILLVPFGINQVRTGLHPQLLHGDLSGQSTYGSSVSSLKHEMKGDYHKGAGMQAEEMMLDSFEAGASMVMSAAPIAKSRRLNEPKIEWGQDDIYTPNFKAQSGIGIPGWSWKTISLHFDNEDNAVINVIALGKTGNMIFQWLQVALLFSMFYFLVVNKVNPKPKAPLTPEKPKGGKMKAAVNVVLMVGILSAALGTTPPVMAAEYPSQAMLESLRYELLKPNACHPNCDFFNSLEVKVEDKKLILTTEYHLQESGVVTLPGGAGWNPESVTLKDGSPLLVSKQSMNNKKGEQAFTAHLSKGIHQVILVGALPVVKNFNLLVLDHPNKVFIESTNNWTVSGVYNHKVQGRYLSFNNTRFERQASVKGEAPLAPLPSSHIDEFYEVKRTITLGDEWRVHTQVNRISGFNQSSSFDLPLLEGEKLFDTESRQIELRGNEVSLTFNHNQRRVQFESSLDPVSKLELKSGAYTKNYVEKWELNSSPLWHIDLEGVEKAGSFDRQGMQSMYWLPKPGKELTIYTYALKGAEDLNQTASRVENASWELALADKEARFTLKMTTKASFNNPITLVLPEGARLNELSIDGSSLPPITSEGNAVHLDIPGGRHRFNLSGVIEGGISAAYALPVVDFGMPVTNYTTRVTPSQQSDKRWFLSFSSDAVGPAVLFWGEFAVLLIISLALGKKRFAHLAGWQWALLSLGFLQLHFLSLMVFVALFAAFKYRAQDVESLSQKRWTHNFLQIGLVFLFLVAMMVLLGVIANALMSYPDMQIKGNGSTGHHMNWYQDAIFEGHPMMPITLYSVPLWTHKAVMLLWSLWVSFSLISWAKTLWLNWSKKQHWIEKPKKSEL